MTEVLLNRASQKRQNIQQKRTIHIAAHRVQLIINDNIAHFFVLFVSSPANLINYKCSNVACMPLVPYGFQEPYGFNRGLNSK